MKIFNLLLGVRDLLIIYPIRYLFRPFSKWILKYEMEFYEKNIKCYDKWNKGNRLKIDVLDDFLSRYKNLDTNINDIVSQYNINYMAVTKNKEPVIISSYN